MIESVVNDRWQAWFPLVLARSDGSSATIQVMFDCGYNGHLALPKAIVQDLALPRGPNSKVVLADGRTRMVRTYLGLAALDGRLVELPIAEIDDEPLAGMKLLAGFRVTIDIHPGGRVALERLPEPANPETP